MIAPHGSAAPSYSANIRYSSVSGSHGHIIGPARPICPVKKMTATAIQGANIAKAAHSQQSGTLGASYSVTVVNPCSNDNGMALTESRNRLGNGSNGKDCSKCENSGDRMQLHASLQVTKNHNSQVEPVRRFHVWRDKRTPPEKGKAVRKNALRISVRSARLMQSDREALQMTNAKIQCRHTETACLYLKTSSDFWATSPSDNALHKHGRADRDSGNTERRYGFEQRLRACLRLHR